MKIRHEINLLNGPVTCDGNTSFNVSATANCPKRVFDFSKFSGTLSFYIEVVYTNTITTGDCLVGIWSSGNNAGNGASPHLSNNVTTLTLYRAPVGFGVSSGTPAFHFIISTFGSGAGTVTVKAARLIIIQNTSTDILSASETAIEIGNTETGKTNTTDAALAAPKYWKYDSSLLDGVTTFYAEVSYLVSSSMTSVTIKLQEDDGNFGSWTDKVTIVSGGTALTATRERSAAFTPTSGRNYRIVGVIGSNMFTYDIYNASIIIQQSAAIDSYPSSNFSGTFTMFGTGVGSRVGLAQAFTGTGHSVENAVFYIAKSGFPTGTAVAKIYAMTGTLGSTGAPTGSALATSNDVSVSTLNGTNNPITFTFPTPFATSAGTNYCIVLEYTDGDTSNYITVAGDSSSPTHSGNVATQATVGGAWTPNSGSDVLFSVNMSGITKLIEQYLLANTTIAAGTSLQNFLTKWDPAEWDGVDNAYVHQVDASDNNTSVVEIDTVAPAQVAGSLVNTPDNSETADAIINQPTQDSNYNLGTTDQIGESFTASGNVGLYKATFWMSKGNAPTGTMVCKLYAHSGDITLGTSAPTGAALATSDTIDVSTLPNTPTEITFTFPKPYILSFVSTYVVVIECNIAPSGTDVVKIYYRNTNIYTGNLWKSGTGPVSTQDLYVKLYPSMNMPASSTNLDMKATTNSGNVYASRILVRISKTVVAGGAMTAALTATGSVSGTAKGSGAVASSLSGSGTVSGTLKGSAAATCALTASATLSASGQAFAQVAATLSAAALIAATLVGAAAAQASTAATASLSATVAGVGSMAAATTSTASLSATGTLYLLGSAALTGSGTLAGTATAQASLQAHVGATGTVAATLSGSAPAGASLSGSASVQAVLSGSAGDSANLSAAAVLSGTLSGVASLNSALSAAGSLSASAILYRLATAALAGQASLDGQVSGSVQAQATLSATGTLSGEAVLYLFAEAALAATATLEGAASGQTGSAASLSCIASLSGELSASGLAASILLGEGAVEALLSGTAAALADLGASAFVDGALLATGALGCDLVAASDLSATLSGNQGSAANPSAVAALEGTLSGSAPLLSDAAAAAALQGTLLAEGALQSGVSCLSSFSGTLSAAAYAAANLDTTASLTGSASADQSSQASLGTQSSVVATLQGAGSLAAGLHGASSIAANPGAGGGLSAALTGTGNLTGTLSGEQSLSPIKAALTGQALVAGTMGGAAGASCQLTAEVVMVASVAGAAALAADLISQSVLLSSGIAIPDYEREIICLRSEVLDTELALESKIDFLVLESAVVDRAEVSSGNLQVELSASSGMTARLEFSSQLLTVLTLSSTIKPENYECL